MSANWCTLTHADGSRFTAHVATHAAYAAWLKERNER